MYCHNCGKAVVDGAKFCSECGTPLTGEAEIRPAPSSNKVLCPNCGSDNIHFVTSQTSSNFDKGDACCGYLLCGPLGLLCGVKDQTEPKTVRKCMSCNTEF